MKTVRTIALCVGVSLASCVLSPAQQPDPKTQAYSKDGLSFDYSKPWNLHDKSTDIAQHLLLSREGGSTLIMVLAYRYLITSAKQLDEGRKDVTERFIEDAKQKLGAPAAEVQGTPQQLTVDNEVAEGVRLRGSINGEPTTAEVYSFLGKLRFINLAYIRPDKDSQRDDPAWTAIIKSLKVATPVLGSRESGGQRFISYEGILNGRATRLGRPEYPMAARREGAQGTVTVRVIIDESGNVAEVISVTGHPALVQAAASAARRSKFKPTVILGQPVRVAGVITYNFVRL
jgi:TonB family protein